MPSVKEMISASQPSLDLARQMVVARIHRATACVSHTDANVVSPCSTNRFVGLLVPENKGRWREQVRKMVSYASATTTNDLAAREYL